MAAHLLPTYHLTAPEGQWLNDPCGPYIDSEGTTHLHFQNNPFNVDWGNMHWGQVETDDFLTWRRADFGIVPLQNLEFDENTPNPDVTTNWEYYHAFSGGALAEGFQGRPTLFYTGIPVDFTPHWTQEYVPGQERQGFQYLDENGNPVKVEVVAAPDPDWTVTGFRDPFVWPHGDEFLMVVAGGFKSYIGDSADPANHVYEGGAIFLYKTVDGNLTNFEAQKTPFFHPQEEVFGVNIEVANYFTLEDPIFGTLEFLTISCEYQPRGNRTTLWVMGNLLEDAETGDITFEHTAYGFLDQGMMYAPTTLDRPVGGRTLFTWLDEAGSVNDAGEREVGKMGSSGILGLPRQIHLQSRGFFSRSTADPANVWHMRWSWLTGPVYYTMGMRPMPEVETLRSPIAGLPEDATSGIDIGTNSYEVTVTGSLGAGDRIDLSVLGVATVSYDFDSATLSIDGSTFESNRCGLVETLGVTGWVHEDINMDVFVDGSSIEVFVNERCVMSGRAYPEETDAITSFTYSGPEGMDISFFNFDPILEE